MSNTTKSINSVIKTIQPYEAAMWDGLELLTIDTTDSVYNFPNLAISYTIYSKFTRVQISQLVNHKMVALGCIEIAKSASMDMAIVSFMLGCEIAESVSSSKNVETPRQRLAKKLRPAYLALGIVASTETGKFLFAMAYDSDYALDVNNERFAQYENRRPSKGSQDAMYYKGMSLGQRNSYVTALASMCAEASNGQASRQLCRRIINMEIDAMRNRTVEQIAAAPITAIFDKAYSE